MMDNKKLEQVIPGKLRMKTTRVDPVLDKMKKIITKDIPTKETTAHLSKDEQNYLHRLEEQINTEKSFGYLTPENDTRTAAEKLFDERKLKKLPEKIKKEINVTFKQKYENYNKNLSRLPEHYDIPKVGPG
jgi:protein FAM32A